MEKNRGALELLKKVHKATNPQKPKIKNNSKIIKNNEK